MALVVQKYGGTSVGMVEQIRNVARRVVAAREQGNDVVVVVSAMSGETNRLVNLANQISSRLDDREIDVLLASGEQASCALLALALKEQGQLAHSLLGYQVRIITDSVHGRARIKTVESTRVLESLKRNEVVVVAGFQGVDEDNNITTLGRGGSDTSAVAMAAALGASVCEIYSDVDGIYTADPFVCSRARKLDWVTYDEMLEMASLGARVLQTRSVEMAKKFGVKVHLRSSFEDTAGTWLVKEGQQMDSALVSAVTCDNDEAKITIRSVPDRVGLAAQIFGPIAEANIVVDMIIQNAGEDGTTDVTFTVPKKDYSKAMELIEKTAPLIQAKGLTSDTHIAKVSVVGVGVRTHADVAAKMFQALAEQSINIEMISTSEIKVSVVVDEKDSHRAVDSLHASLIESR